MAPDSTTETYAAMRLDIDNWRWEGVPFFIRTGKHLPITQTELRLIFRRPPQLLLPPRPLAPARAGAAGGQARPVDRGQAARRGAAGGLPEGGAVLARPRVRRAGRGGADALRGPAARRDARRQHALHAPGQRRGDVAGAPAAARLARRSRALLREGELGPGGRRRGSSPTTAAGTDRGWGHEHRRRRPARARVRRAERGGAVAVPADRRLRVPVGLPHRRARRARRRDRLAVRAALRRAERVRHAARPRGGHVPARAVRDQPPVRRGRTSPARTRSSRRGRRRPAGSRSATR